MDVIESRIRTDSPEFLENHARITQLVAELRDRLAKAREGGGPRYVQRHREQGKLPVRDRIDHLLDSGSPFLELSPLAAFEMYDGDATAAGLVTGIGRVCGREVVVVANDATFKGGTYYPITVKKHVRAQEIALQKRLPCVCLVDSGGAFLPLQAEVFPDRDHFGRIFFNQTRMSAERIPQIAAVMGSCTAGGVYEVAISDTIGIAHPAQVSAVLASVAARVPLSRIALYFHDTRGTALTNVLAGLLIGVRTFDASAGGLGGCPYAPGASGNLATEDLLYVLNGLGIETGVSLDGVMKASPAIEPLLGHPLPSRVVRSAMAI